MTEIPLSRLFSISSFEALRTLRCRQPYFPAHSLLEIAKLLERVDATARGLDFQAAFSLAQLLPENIPVDAEIAFYQKCIEAVVIEKQPVWAKIMTRGRAKFAQKLSEDEAQCFRQAGLLVEPITPDILKWWDRITAHVRSQGDQIKHERARAAEKLSLQHEVERLRQLGIPKEPTWVAVEDNTAGYDVLSFDIGTVEPTNRLIEVKSTIASPLRFQITRNEWEQACRFRDRYHFHIWDMSGTPRLYERAVDQIAPHIPSDNRDGRWLNAEIQVGSTN